MINVSQVTNFSPEVTGAPIKYISVYIGNSKYVTVQYYNISAERLTGSATTPINKLGYVCEPRGIDYPIMITTDDVSRTIQIGKTGMFEVQPETFLDMNDVDAEEIECLPKITSIMLPKGIMGDQTIKFKLDYAFSIN